MHRAVKLLENLFYRINGRKYLSEKITEAKQQQLCAHISQGNLFVPSILLLFKSTRLFLAYITQQDQPLKSHYPTVPTNQTDPFFEATLYAWGMEKHYYCHPYTRAVGIRGGRGRSVNTIPAGRGRLCPPHTCPSGLSDLLTALKNPPPWKLGRSECFTAAFSEE